MTYKYSEYDPSDDYDLQCPVCGYEYIRVDAEYDAPTRPQCYCPRCETEDDLDAFKVVAS